MSFAITTGVVSVGMAGYQVYNGIQQKNKAKRIRDNAVDPGIKRNYALDRTTEALFQNYSNWNLPGYEKYIQHLQSNQATANNAAMLGSGSSADVLNAVTANQAVADQSLGGIAIESASGRERALMEYLNSVKAQGQDQLRMDAQREARYQGQLNEAAAYEAAGIQNTNTAINDAVIGITALGQAFMPRQTIDQSTGQMINLPSIWSTYRKGNNNATKNNFTVAPGYQRQYDIAGLTPVGVQPLNRFK